ncbi:class II glutamine amidotransferase [Corallincola luteus]|uniref:Class II glutamine amidotransferase n=1 Tax=Corallincola luteus TaxID=1775177 RepID=A0ABY2AQK9_9GAMM|nr:class II glutamine amidotransferase [Corallincola luteus]TCI05479.1 class II glutamine amidotransferase [Corallincola luteus]
MCELLGMSANVPTDICFSFSGLMQRGGNTGPHRDGWGITFYEGKGCRSFKDPNPAAESRIAELVQSYPIKSRAVIGHIRLANRGGVCLENTHPFTRDLWGRSWTFAHNGQLSGYKKLPVGQHLPIGCTDSERAFCFILNALTEKYKRKPGNMPAVFKYIATLCDELRAMGVYNMLLTDGEYVMAYCSNNLHWLTRRAPFGEAVLKDQDWQLDFHKETTPDDVVTVFATQPLTINEQWYKMAAGEFTLFCQGEQIL